MILAVLAAGACSGPSAPPSVPRPRAYPRIEVYPPEYRDLKVGPLILAVNEGARSQVNGLWADIAYPAYGMTVNLTVTPVSSVDLEQVIDNRTERMALNLGGAQAQMTQFLTEGGASATLLVSRSASGLTPIQFLATDSAGWVLSGVVAAADAVANLDSIRPALDSVEADVVEMLRRL